MAKYSSYLVSDLPIGGEAIDLGPGVSLRGLPKHLGVLTEPSSPISLLFRKVAAINKETAIRLSVNPRSPVTAELYISDVAQEHFYDSVQAALLVKMFLTVCGFGNCEVLCALTSSLDELASVPQESVTIHDIDLLKGGIRHAFMNDEPPEVVIERARGAWGNFVALMNCSERERFRLALEATEASRYAYEPRFALASLWVGPEAIFARDASEATFKLTSAWASYVCERGSERIETQKRLQKLYSLRSKAVHGHRLAAKEFRDAYAETFFRFMNCLWLILQSGELPPADDLLEGIFE